MKKMIVKRFFIMVSIAMVTSSCTYHSAMNREAENSKILQDEINKENKNKVAIVSTNKKLQGSKNRLIREISDNNRAIDESNDKIDNLSQRIANVEKKIAQNKNDQSKVNQYQREKKKLDSEVRVIKSKVKSLRAANVEKRNELDKYL